MTSNLTPPVASPTRPLRPMIVIFVAFAAVMAVVGWSKWHVPAEKVKWTDHFAAAQQTARQQNKPVLLYFTASWCGPCQEMRRSVWTEQSVADALASYVTVRIDIDREPDLARQYHTESIPQFFLLDSGGNIRRSQTGAMDADQFLGWLGSATAYSTPSASGR